MPECEFLDNPAALYGGSDHKDAYCGAAGRYSRVVGKVLCPEHEEEAVKEVM